MEENRTLLIVDDEQETLKGYSEFLTPKEAVVVRKSSRKLYGTGPQETPGIEPYRLILAKSGEEAIKLFETELKEGRRVAAGFFDVKLGAGMDGLATIHAIKAMDRDIHCVVVTAYHDRTVEEINQLFGEDFKDQWDYLNKPFTQGEIVQKARQMVAAWNRKREVEFLSQQLVRSERLASVGQVARGVGHEFSNILQRIMGKVDLALIEPSPEKVAEHLGIVLKAVERAGVLVRNLQSFTKAEPQLRVGSVLEPMEEALSLISHDFIKHSIQLEKSFQKIPDIKCDSGALAQVYLNLLINAVHAMPNGGKIQVVVEQPAGGSEKPGVVVRVADTGCGIPDEVIPRIFDYAFSTKGDHGSGLGLSIARDIVESHGGKISVKTQVGKGTEFTIWLPLQK